MFRYAVAGLVLAVLPRLTILALDTVTVTDLNPGPAGSGVSNLTVFNDVLYFSANDEPHGSNTELWRYDGLTVELAAEIRSGTEGSNPSSFVVHNGTLYFGARGDNGPSRLWRFDGTAASLAPGSNSQAQNPSELTSYNGLLYFRAFRSGLGTELWRFDGSEQTQLELIAGSGSSFPQHIVEYQGQLHFNAAGRPGDGSELWRYDGTLFQQVSDLNADGGSAPAHFAELQGHLYFAAYDGVNGNELWRTDGSQTELVADIVPGGRYDSGNPSFQTTYRDAIFFSADNGVDGSELWRYNGTQAEMVADINPTTPLPDVDPVHHSWPRDFFVFHEVLYFSADDGEHGRELWSYDGVKAQLVKDINPGPYGSNISGFAVYRDTLYFHANDGQGGELTEARTEVMMLVFDPEPFGNFQRGDCNGDGTVAGEVSDAVFLLNFNFLAGPEPPCLAACDANGDGNISGEVSDAVYLLIFNFLSGSAPPAPFPDCGQGTVEDEELGCEAPPKRCQ